MPRAHLLSGTFGTGSAGWAFCWRPARCSLFFSYRDRPVCGSPQSVRRHSRLRCRAGVLRHSVLASPLFGALLQWRSGAACRPRAEPVAIKIDLSRPRDRRILGVFAVGSVVFLFITALGSYQTYQYTESVQFCGQDLPPADGTAVRRVTAHRTCESGMRRLPCRPGCGRIFQNQSERRETTLSHRARRFRPAHPHQRGQSAAAAGHLRTMPLAAALRRQRRAHLSALSCRTKRTRPSPCDFC